ncbi:3-oxoacyl-[acyl-carrier-protein] synthase-3 [Tessaracoccus bendigoensis DSM 12906]|uniref:Beta-ketoacyl-[acyl-carrier-protein] synthase III n=1 Tax=Tessaracoccus bendigoensis DSM 12906 TaxID=1123357 RepID=A0A1M6GU29_9ACTN|nr:beta-ketoacyl-ACP synthase III [Tessaracoccus bendigoensis]SHJ13447.1 3-oxoacyl-[acyl-carrier-protein] synthase-3 [Tessaracoccus bendigoensis DSM 12906]
MALKTSTGAEYARIMSVGGARGSRVVSNEEMCTLIDSTPEWIQQRTGITERHWVAEGEDVETLGIEAAGKAIERAGLQPSDIDAILVSTVSHYQQTPSLACILAGQLGLGAPAAFDISGACAGFCYGVCLAESMVRSGSAKHVLVIGAETLSRYTDFSDRSTAFLFSDGAGAVVVGPSDVPAIGPTVWGSKPEAARVIEIDDWRQVNPSVEGPFIHMEGREVFKWATTAIVDKAVEALSASGLTPEELDCFIPHQANNRITDSMLRHLKLPEDVVVSRDIIRMGNSSAASIPLAMEALLESGQAKSGDSALIIGFGAGLVFAGQTVILP